MGGCRKDKLYRAWRTTLWWNNTNSWLNISHPVKWHAWQSTSLHRRLLPSWVAPDHQRASWCADIILPIYIIGFPIIKITRFPIIKITRFPIIKITRSQHCLIFIINISIPGNMVSLYTETGPNVPIPSQGYNTTAGGQQSCSKLVVSWGYLRESNLFQPWYCKHWWSQASSEDALLMTAADG